MAGGGPRRLGEPTARFTKRTVPRQEYLKQRAQITCLCRSKPIQGGLVDSPNKVVRGHAREGHNMLANCNTCLNLRPLSDACELMQSRCGAHRYIVSNLAVPRKQRMLAQCNAITDPGVMADMGANVQ